MNNVPGVYRITCYGDSKVYIGSTKALVNRLQQHRWHLKNNRHHNPILQNAYNKYGPESFSYEVIERCREDELIEREQHWIDFYQAATSFNVVPRADRKEVSDETKRKISLAHLGKIKSPVTRERMREAQRKRTPEWNKAISDGKKGKSLSKEHREKLSEAKIGKIPEGWKNQLKPCECVDTGQRFDSLREAERFFGIGVGTLHAALKRGSKCQGKLFRFIEGNKNG